VTHLIGIAMGGIQVTTIPEHDAPERRGSTGDGCNGKSGPGRPGPPLWAQIYMWFLILAVIVWIILCALHGGPPGITVLGVVRGDVGYLG
jgi:hypothetical protein